MRAPARLALYGLLLVVLFAASYLLADLLVPTQWAETWSGTAGH
ncbi:hypothetical protein [Brachybacterium sp. YJGR34]|nr:hypothetical protein [Brachybacterium sp. YJGR34]